MQSLRDRFFGDDESWTDIASAGNGGVATASANGGVVAIGDVNSGGNAGSAIGIGDTSGGPGGGGGGTRGNSTARRLPAHPRVLVRRRRAQPPRPVAPSPTRRC